MSRITFIIRIIFCVIILFILYILVAGHFYYVQIVRNSELYTKARRLYTSVKNQKGQRGRIFDVSGHLLVGNIPCADIIVDPKHCGDDLKCRRTAVKFSKILGQPAADIYKSISTKKKGKLEIRYKVIERDVSLESAEKIRNVINEEKINGIFIEEKYKRYYPKNELLSNILGLTSSDDNGVKAINGIEKFFDKQLTPTKAVSSYERDRKGAPLAYGRKNIMHERDGNDIFLTISEPIQVIMEEELEHLVEKYNPRAAYAIMADPFTGNVIALAQRPTFNPNERKDITPEMWRDRYITDVFEPGSTMKGISIAGALDYKVVTPSTRIDCEKGRWFYAGKLLRDSHPYDVLDISEIVKYSSNIGTAKVALMLGEKRLYQVLRRFGFGQKTGIPIQPEATGSFRKIENWDKLSITRFPIGHGISCSPMQLVRAYCAIANGGTLLKMRLVTKEKNPETGEIVVFPIEKGTKVFINDDTAGKIVSMLKLVTQEGGTAEKAFIPGYEVAGKTGTSQKYIDGTYNSGKYFSAFVGFVPADNPAFVLLVMADEAKGSYYGGTVSAPTFRNISEKTLRFMNIQPQYKAE